MQKLDIAMAAMAAVVAASLVACGPVANADEVESRKARALLESALKMDGGPGMMAAVMQDGELLYSGAVGRADIESRRAMTTDTRMRIGSVSKIITAALAAKLVEAGRLDPDADIHELVPEFPRKPGEDGQPITPRMLADHTSGIRHYDFSDMAEANNQVHYDSLVQALPVFADDPLVAPPGARPNYSSFGFNLLGIAAGRAAGSDFRTAVMAEVAAPIGLTDTLPDHALAIIPRRTEFHTVFGGRLVNTFWRDSSDYYPSGGMLSTAEDLARLAHAVFEGGFLRGTGRTLMVEETTSGAGPTGYSFGGKGGDDPDGTVHYEHGGETNGAYAWLYYDPESSLIVAGATNYNVYPAKQRPAFHTHAMAGLVSLFGGQSIGD